MHGDLVGFKSALAIFAREKAGMLLCPGDIVERGSDADEIVRLIGEYNFGCIKGNHEHSVIRNQKHWRAAQNPVHRPW